MKTSLVPIGFQHLKTSVISLLAADSPEGVEVEQRLSAAVRSRLGEPIGGAAESPLWQLIAEVELPGVAALQNLTLREILEQTVGRVLEPDDGALQKDYERLRERLTETKPLRELLQLDRPLGEHSLFKDIAQSIHVAEVLRLTPFPSSDESVAAFLTKMGEFNGPSPEFWTAAAADSLVSADVLQSVRETFELSRLTFGDLPLLRALVAENITAAKSLTGWDAGQWRQFLAKHSIAPPKGIADQNGSDQNGSDDYAVRLEERIAQRFPTTVFFHRLDLGRIDRQRDELRRAASEIQAESGSDSPTTTPSLSRKQEGFTIGAVLAPIRKPFRGKKTEPARPTDASREEPKPAPAPADTRAARDIRSLFSGLGLNDILADSKLSVEEKVDRVVQLGQRLGEFHRTNPDLDLLRADFHRDIHVSTDATEQRPLLALDSKALGDLRAGPVPDALRDAMAAEAKIELRDTARLVAADGGWRIEDAPSGQNYPLYRSGDSLQLFQGIDWAGVGEDRARVENQLKVYQRLLRIDPRFETVDRLLNAGYDSAWKIALESDTTFLHNVAGDSQQGQAIRLRAYAISENAALTAMNAKSAIGAEAFRNAFFGNTTEDVIEFLKRIPGYSELFDLPRFCDCKQCKSIFGPPAYLVDLMRFIAVEITDRNSIDPARSLHSRRSDIWDIPLDCANANRLIPYIDIVNEILERRVQAETGKPPYEFLHASAVHPFALPFHLPLAQVRAYLGHFKSRPLFEIFQAFGRAERWLAAEYLGLSKRDFEIITNPAISAGPLGRAYGVANPGLRIPQEFWGLMRVDNFLAHTGLTRSELSELLFQNLDATERPVPTGPVALANFRGDRQADFFINNVYDNAAGTGRLGSLAIAMNENDPEDVHEELRNLSPRKLDRIHRFIRLSRRLGWTFADLDWVLRSINRTDPNGEIDADAIIRLFKIKRWQDRYNLPLDVLTSLWSDLKTTGRLNPDGPEPLDFFDRVFNSPKVLRGAPAYNLPGAQVFLALRRFDRTDPVDPNRGWLLAALELTDGELNQIAATMPANPVPLTLANLSYFYRISRLPKIAGLTLREFLLFLAGRGVATTQAAINAHLRDFDALEATLELIAWAKSAGWSIDTLDYLRTNQPNDLVDPGFHVDDVRTLLEALSSNPLLQETAFTALANVNDAQSQGLFAELVTQGFVARTQPDDAFGRLTVAFTPDAPGFTLGLNPPYDDPVEEARLINLLRQNHNPSLPEAARRQRILEGLASFFGVAPDLIAALIGLTDEPLNSARITVLTTTINSTDAQYANIVHFLRKLHARVLLAGRFHLRVDEINGLVAHAASFGLGPLDTLPFIAVRNLHRYRLLTDKFGDGDGRLLQFIAQQPTDPALLTALTGWEQPQIEAVAAALVNNLALANLDGVYRAIDGLDRLARCFDLIKLLKIDARTLLDWSDWNNKNWAGQTAVARATLEVFKARYGEDAWTERFEPVEDHVRELKRDALAAWLTSRYRPNGIRDREDLYQFLLIDVNMTSCEKISRIKEALNSLQLYMHRSLMNLESDVSPDTIPRKQWRWMKNYRVWEANRKVFLYPENYIEPESRDDKTTLYRELEDELLQGDVTKATVEAAYRNYLDKLAEIANLTIAGSYYHENPDTGTRTLHLIGRTRTAPHTFYHRSYIDETRWTPWERIELSIKSEFVSPIFAFQRLFIFWVEITKQQHSQIVNGNSGDPVDEYKASIFYSFRTFNGRWTPPQTLQSEVNIGRYRTKFAERFYPGFRYLDPQQGTRYYDRISGIYDDDWGYPELRENLAAMRDSIRFVFDPRYWAGFLGVAGVRLIENSIDQEIHSQDWLYAWILEEQRKAQPNFVSSTLLDNVSSACSVQVVNNTFDWNASKCTWTVFDNGDEQFLVRLFNNSDELDAFRNSTEMYPNLDPGPYPRQYKYQFLRISTSIVLTLSRLLLAGGVDRLLSIASQQLTELPFDRLGPYSEFVFPPASDKLDFEGPYGQYYKEIFFHVPCLIANRLNANQQFEDAQRWYHYVFDPTAAESNSSLAHPHDRYWRYLPFRGQTLPSFADALSNTDALTAYHDKPFQPHTIARLRVGAYPKNVVMKYLDNLIDWAEYLFRQDTWESITEGTMLYVMAYQILGGTPPERLDPCDEPPTRTYRELEAAWGSAASIPEFLIEIENSSTIRPALLFSVIGGATKAGGLTLNPEILDNLISTTRNSASMFYFCFPENQQLRNYWQRVTDGLYKIRHCLDITGKRRQLKLYEPAIDPAALVRAVAGGRDLGAALADLLRPLPHYRFVYLIEKARQFTAQVVQFGGALLAALEKKDAEDLALLRTTHEKSIQNLTVSVREKQRDAAVESHAALEIGRASAVTRQSHYGNLLAKGLSSREELHLASMMIAWYLDQVSQMMNLSASAAHLVPNAGSPFAMTYGGREVGSSLRGVAEAFHMYSSFANLIGSMSSIMGGYQRRAQDWTLQNRLAGHDVEQIDRQIAAADFQRQIAEQEIKILTRTQEQTDEMQVFLEDKFTGKALYQWMSGNLAGLYFQSYQLAVDMAKLAERAFQFERNTNETHIQFGHWDSLKRGLLAGERLTLELNRLEKAYLDDNARTLEIEKHVSLAQLDPEALFTLKASGVCEFELPEILFDYDFPGHYCRKIKTVAISIPAIMGPYESVKATLTQAGNRTLLIPDAAACQYLIKPEANQAKPDDSVLRVDWRPREEIAISSANNDAGAFELNFRDERYLPFEGTGAVSHWRLSMPRQTNRFSFDTISDVVVHLRYTALSEAGPFRDAVVALLADAPLDGFRMLSVRHEFSAAWQRFMHPAPGSQAQRLEIPISPQLFPANMTINSIRRVFLFLETAPDVQPPGITIALQPAGGRLTAPGAFIFDNGFIKLLDVTNGDQALDAPWVAQTDRTAIPPALRRQSAAGGDEIETIAGQAHYLLDDTLITNLGMILAYEADVGWN